MISRQTQNRRWIVTHHSWEHFPKLSCGNSDLDLPRLLVRRVPTRGGRNRPAYHDRFSMRKVQYRRVALFQSWKARIWAPCLIRCWLFSSTMCCITPEQTESFWQVHTDLRPRALPRFLKCNSFLETGPTDVEDKYWSALDCFLWRMEKPDYFWLVLVEKGRLGWL